MLLQGATRASLRLAALPLAALALFAAHAYAPEASALVNTRAPRPSAFSSRTLDAPVVQRRRRAKRRRGADALVPGLWGGRGIRFEAADDGAELEFDCARATVGRKITVDAAGRFSADATYYQDTGARPVREGEAPRGTPVRLAGRVGGSLMRLTVTRGAGRIGDFSLARDREPELTKCM